MTRKAYLYQHHTWPELGQAAKRQPVVVLPDRIRRGSWSPSSSGCRQFPDLEHLRSGGASRPKATFF